MKAEITFSQLWLNNSLMNFFFRTQSEDTLNELFERVVDTQNAVETIDAYCDANDISLDELEEMFYSESVEDLAEEFCIELSEEEEEDDDED